jgi:ribonuclease D
LESYQIIESAGALDALVERLHGEARFALDTEFVWERTYHARLGLVQIGLADGACFLIDPVAIRSLAPLGPVLAAPGILKLLHDAPQDLTILRQATGVATQYVFDTRLAAGFAGLSAVISLSKLVAALVGVHLPKEHTRTDWMQRPLAPACLAYAADDVRYLPQIADLLRAHVDKIGSTAWLDEEMTALDASAVSAETAPQAAYHRVRGSASLSPRGLAVLRELAAWRENKAREVDRPRRWIAEDRELTAMAHALPGSQADLQRCAGVNPRLIQRQGRALLDAARRGLDLPEADLPPATRRTRQAPSLKPRTDAVLAYVRNRAERFEIDPQLVCGRDAVAALLEADAAAGPDDHALLRGWRAELLGARTAADLLRAATALADTPDAAPAPAQCTTPNT